MKAAAMPSVAAIALLAVAESGLPPEIFLFSIFITTLPKKNYTSKSVLSKVVTMLASIPGPL